MRAALRAGFGEDRAIDEETVIDELLTEVGVDGPSTRAEAASPAYKPRLRGSTERASAAGIFGAPQVRRGRGAVWGNDRLEQALAFAHGSSCADAA